MENNRLRDIARKWLPTDQRFDLRVVPYESLGIGTKSPGPSGCYWGTAMRRDPKTGQKIVVDKVLSVPEPTCPEALYVWLHECGHARNRHHVRSMPTYLKEFEAEDFAHAVFREEGLEVPEYMQKNAVLNVVRRALEAGVRAHQAEPRVAAWARNNYNFGGK